MTDQHKAILFISGIALFVFLLIGSVVAFAYTRGDKEAIPEVDWDAQSDFHKPLQVEPHTNERQNISSF
ncbi:MULTISPECIES: hypothetical protein [unclassified Lentimonas]|uniref:hypothetical protein n=1 Tax=unclassified Lentimonas TaxID=2630993 RepID=UPI001323EF56|nr:MULTISPECIES: hypothetical protein [unclassified Lentimonas]CAA6696244.1 Unannotated [Lentimonas sp. CC10]CAA6697493.1 Unannotated [Lentimonas sp. CC19]CAA7071231.1 Unannotated [Lentimonas sp. CC11]